MPNEADYGLKPSTVPGLYYIKYNWQMWKHNPGFPTVSVEPRLSWFENWNPRILGNASVLNKWGGWSP